MSGKPKTEVNIQRLRNMYINQSIPMDEVAAAFGYSRRQIVNIIEKLRAADPDDWPKRYPKLKK